MSDTHDETFTERVCVECDEPLSVRRIPRDVYEQILEDHPIDEETGQLRGHLLGQVNAHTPRCSDWGWRHAHVLWLKNGHLRIGLVDEPRWQEDLSQVKGWKRTWRCLCALHDLLALLLAPGADIEIIDRRVKRRRYTVQVGQYRLRLSKRPHSLLRELARARKEVSVVDAPDRINGSFRSFPEREGGEASEQALLGEMEHVAISLWERTYSLLPHGEREIAQDALGLPPPLPSSCVVSALLGRVQHSVDDYVESMEEAFAKIDDLEQLFLLEGDGGGERE